MSSIITPQISSIQTKRVSTGTVTAGLSALVTVTWTTAFADTNYTATASVLNSTAAALALTVLHIETQSASAITVRILNTAVSDLTGTIFAVAVHD